MQLFFTESLKQNVFWGYCGPPTVSTLKCHYVTRKASLLSFQSNLLPLSHFLEKPAKILIALSSCLYKYQEFAIKTEILKFFIFSHKKPFSETFSKIKIKVSKAFSFSRKLVKSEMLRSFTPYSHCWIIRFITTLGKKGGLKETTSSLPGK